MSWKNWFKRKEDTVKREATQMSGGYTSTEGMKEGNHEVSASKINYPRPRILLVDLEPGAVRVLREKGYNVSESSLGTPYSVRRSCKF